MNSAKTVARNSVYLIAVRVIIPLTSFIVFITIARKMGVEAVGHYTFLVTMFFVFCLLSTLGLSPLLVRDTSQRPGDRGKLYSSAITLGVNSIILWAPLMVVIAWVGPYSTEVLVSLAILAAGLPFGYVGLINEAMFMGAERFGYIPIINLFESIYLLISSLAVVWFGMGLPYLALALATSKVVSAVVGSFFLFRAIEIGPLTFNKTVIKDLLRMTPPFFLIYAIGLIFYRIDILLLSWLVSDRDLGLYAAANKIYLFALVLPESFVRALYPRISAMAVDGNVRDISLRAIRYGMIAITPVVIVIFVFGGSAIGILFGSEYESSTPILAILIWAMLPYIVYSILGNVLMAGGHQWTTAKFGAAIIAVNIVLTYIMIRAIGYPGAAVAMVASMMLACFVLTSVTSRLIMRISTVFNFLIPSVPAVLGAVVTIYWSWGGRFGRMTAGIVTAILLMRVLKLIDRNDVDWIRRQFFAKRGSAEVSEGDG